MRVLRQVNSSLGLCCCVRCDSGHLVLKYCAFSPQSKGSLPERCVMHTCSPGSLVTELLVLAQRGYSSDMLPKLFMQSRFLSGFMKWKQSTQYGPSSRCSAIAGLLLVAWWLSVCLVAACPHHMPMQNILQDNNDGAAGPGRESHPIPGEEAK